MAFKNLSSYTDQPITELFNKYGAFWAFSNQQFETAKQDQIEYVKFWGNCFCNKETAKEFIAEYHLIFENQKKLFLHENSREDIIKYELANYECYYTGEIEEAFEVLQQYGISYNEVQKVYYKELPKYD